MYNHNNTLCAWCSQWVFKGEGVFHNFRGGFTLCKECNASRNKNMEQAKKKRKFRKNQLNLFTNQGGK